MSINRRQRGLTLIELIMFIVIVGVAIAGVLTVLNHTTQHSADPMIRKQMLAIAEAVLEEVMLQPVTWCDPGDPNAATATGYTGVGNCTTVQNTAAGKVGESRSSATVPFDNVLDYNGENITTSITGSVATSVPSGYSAYVDVGTDATLGGASAITDTDAVLLITVTACRAATCPSAGAESIQLQGYRTRHSPNMLP
jgi:MSHA pilin protein MshD